MSTIREQIISNIITEAENISTSVGYTVSLGTNVYRAVKNFDADPAIVIHPQPEKSERDYRICRNTMAIKLEGFKTFGSTNASEISEQILGDLIEFMTGTTYTMPFTSGGTKAIALGDTITGHTSSATAYVIATAVTGGTWAAGTAAGNFTLRRKKGDFTGENLDVGTITNIATTTGVISAAQSPITRVTNSLAIDIEYVSGGTDEYPEGAGETVGAYAIFNIVYETLFGNPYGQP